MTNQRESLDELAEKKEVVLGEIANLAPFRPGSLEHVYRKCGKPSCHCAQPGARGHGPVWILTRKVNGKSVGKVIKEDAVESTQEQIQHYHQFQELIREYVETNVKICDKLLERPKTEGLSEAEKGGL
ncbi:MAG TPA: hypothetical protein PLE76_09920 [Rectinema sp.]|nr:hypothetical protein [Rectinema sp.]HRU78813.1 hypothetical protein [Rectinema sp.]